MKDVVTNYGRHAIATGVSAGIGAVFGRQLAAASMHPASHQVCISAN
jgi:hypothetical protein